MIVPFGLAMLIGRVVGRLLTTCAERVQKWAVLPLSAMANLSGGMVIGGGPMGSVDKQKSEYSLMTLVGLIVRLGSHVDIGSPRRQLVAGGGAAAADRVVVSWRGRPAAMVLLPPCIRKTVASVLWPAALRGHVSEV